MTIRRVLLWLAAAGLCFGQGKKLPAGEYSNDDVQVKATLYAAKEEVNQLIGSDLGGGIVIVDIKVAPQLGGKLRVNRDDFMLRSDKDGQRSQPFAPSQIAGQGALVISSTSGRGMMMGEDRGPVWGGIGGGRPRRMGGDGGGIGNAPSEVSTTARVDSGAKDKPNPVLEVLKERVLPEKETSEPLSGLLYFPMEGKHKTKDLELHYKGPAGKFSLRFK